MSDGPDPLSERIVAGVRLDKYASVHAAVGDGFPLPAVLQHEGIAVEMWDAIETAWAKAILDSVRGEGRLVVAYDEQLLAAQGRMWREMPPIDRDVRAWLDFFRHWAAAEDPLAFLPTQRVGLADFTRLHRHWSRQIEADADLRRQAFEILCAQPGDLPLVEPGPAVLPPPRGTPSEAPARDATALLPPAPALVTAAPVDEKPAVPSLAVRLPPPPADSAPPRPAAARSVAPPPRRSTTPAPRSFALEPDTWKDPLPPPAGSKLSLMTYASASAWAAVHPDRVAEGWAKYGLAGEALRAEHDAWQRQFEQHPEEREDFDRQLDGFKLHWAGLASSIAPRPPASSLLPAVVAPSGIPLRPPAEPLPSTKLSLPAYASGCAWAVIFPDRVDEGWSHYKLVGPALLAEHDAWRRIFDRDAQVREEFEQLLVSLKSHWQRRTTPSR